MTTEDELFWASADIRESVGAQYEATYYSTALAANLQS